MNANIEISDLLQLARTYAEHRGLKLGTVSLRAARQGALFAKLARGEQDLTFGRRDKIARWFSQNWPADLDWPADIPRPQTDKSGRAA